jgi:hypothetical protein
MNEDMDFTLHNKPSQDDVNETEKWHDRDKELGMPWGWTAWEFSSDREKASPEDIERVAFKFASGWYGVIRMLLLIRIEKEFKRRKKNESKDWAKGYLAALKTWHGFENGNASS